MLPDPHAAGYTIRVVDATGTVVHDAPLPTEPGVACVCGYAMLDTSPQEDGVPWWDCERCGVPYPESEADAWGDDMSRCPNCGENDRTRKRLDTACPECQYAPLRAAALVGCPWCHDTYESGAPFVAHLNDCRNH